MAYSVLFAARPTLCATNTSSLWRRATTSLSTAASLAAAARPRGQQPTWSGSGTVVLPSTGTFFRTRRPKPNRKAADRCSATGFLAEIRPKEMLVPQKPGLLAIYHGLGARR